MNLDDLTQEERTLWSRVGALWDLSLARQPEPVRVALHPDYTGWVTGTPLPHDREAAVASVGPSSPRVLSYSLQPLAVSVVDGIVGVVHYTYEAEVESASEGATRVSGRWTEVYMRTNDEWLMVSVSGGPDGER
jgi:hypothetical protein